MKFCIRLGIILILSVTTGEVFAQKETAGTKYTVADPRLIWSLQTQGPIFSSPVISDSVIYIGSLDSIFYAIWCSSGEVVWKYRTSGEIRSSATVNNGMIYFTCGDGNLYCLNGNGKIAWKFSMEFEKKYDFADYYQSSPVVYKSTVYVGSGDGNMYAVDALNGKLLWKYKTGDVIHSTPLVDEEKIFFGSFDGYVYALNIHDGTLIWKFKTVGHRYFPTGEVQGSPSIYQNLIFIGARDYNLYALDKEKGYCHWNRAFNRGWVLSNSTYGKGLYIVGADERILACLDPASGKEIWKKEMEFLMFGKPVINDSVLYIGTTIGKLHAINASSGNDLWVFSTEEYQQNRLKYFTGDDSYRDDIYSIIKSNEQFLEVEIELGGFFSTPVVFGNYLIVTSTNGRVYYFKLSTP